MVGRAPGRRWSQRTPKARRPSLETSERYEFGTHQPLVVFKPGTRATAELEDGKETPLSSLTVHLTEYPFEKMSIEQWATTARFAPGTLPTAGGVHYGLEFTVDEAKALGAKRVSFSEPVAIYVENFLKLPVGCSVRSATISLGSAVAAARAARGQSVGRDRWTHARHRM